MKHKNTRYNIIEPNMTEYRPARPKDIKQSGDLFNIGKYEACSDKNKPDIYVHSSMSNGIQFGSWSMFFLVQKERKKR